MRLHEAGRERVQGARQRGLRQTLGVVEPARVLGGSAQRRPRPVDVAGAHPRLAQTLGQPPRALLVGGQWGRDVDRVRVQARGVLVGELPDGALRRALGEVDGALGPALGRGLQVVVGDLRQMGLEIVAVGLLQCLGGDAVQTRAPGGTEALQQRVAHERVGEAEVAGVAPGDDDLRAQRRLEPVEHGRRRLVEHAGERRHAELPADHRRRAQRLLHERLQRVQAPADGVAHAVGQRQRQLGRPGVVEAALRGEQLDELVDEERVARARGVDRRDELRRDLDAGARAEVAGAGGRQQRDVVAAEPLERQARGRPREAAERRREIRARVRLRVAIGRDRQERDVGQGPGHEQQRVQRRGVGPVQVVEHDDEWALLGDRGKQRRERVEAPEPRLVGVQLRGLRGRAERGAELRQQSRDPGRAGAEGGAQGGKVGAPAQRAADLHPRPVRGRAAAVPAASPSPGGATRGGELDELARQRGLADPRLPGEQDQAAAARQRPLQGRLELGKLPLTPKKARALPSAAQPCCTHSSLPEAQRRPRLF